MVLIGRIIGVSLLAAGLGAELAFVFFTQNPDYSGLTLFLACVGGIIGAVAGAAREIVTARKQNTELAAGNGQMQGPE